MNEGLVAKRARFGQVASWAGIGTFILGFALYLINLFLFGSRIDLFYLSLLSLLVSIYISRIGNYNNRRYGGATKEHQLLIQALKGLDHRYYLFTYLPTLPVEYLLIAPSGVYVLITRLQGGRIVVEGERWQWKRGIMAWFSGGAEGSFGNPTQDIQHGVEQIKAKLATSLSPEELDQAPVQGVVVFLNPNVELTKLNPAIPALTTKELKAFVRKQEGRVTVPVETQSKVVATLGIEQE
ncbi:MAG: hypothetical protein HYX89_02820 [Chloroflexi bacterium]|nr:hypothetical protein [Chloroflexota bacterium]